MSESFPSLLSHMSGFHLKWFHAILLFLERRPRPLRSFKKGRKLSTKVLVLVTHSPIQSLWFKLACQQAPKISEKCMTWCYLLFPPAIKCTLCTFQSKKPFYPVVEGEGVLKCICQSVNVFAQRILTSDTKSYFFCTKENETILLQSLLPQWKMMKANKEAEWKYIYGTRIQKGTF